MSVKNVVQVICDRCEKPVDGHAAGDAAKPLIYAEGSLLVEAARVHFVDLCTKCRGRVQALLAQVRLDDPAPKADDAKAKVGDTQSSPAADAATDNT